jgi:hypothetical protein
MTELLTHCIQQFDNVTNIVNCLWSARIDPLTFVTYLVMVPFLKHFNYSKVLIRLRTLSPDAPLSIVCIPVAILLSLKQNFVQIQPFISVILISPHNRKTA